MVAPSFPIDFDYPVIAGCLRRLGFEIVVEVSVGAQETNRQLLELLKLYPDKRLITAPCPTVVRLIRHKYPELVPYLAIIDSPMSATAKVILKQFPGLKPVFIGPCLAKKLEAKEDRSDLGILVLTYAELKQVFKAKNIQPETKDKEASFDITGLPTRLYPVSGGLAQSAGLNELLTDEEYDVVSSHQLVEKALQAFRENTKLRVLDILYCDGGCLNGPGTNRTLSLEQRRQKIISHWAKGVK